MAKLTLADTASGYNLAPLNNNFTLIETEFQDKVLYRNNPTGEPNHMEQELDMNNNRVFNLPDALTGTEAIPLGQTQRLINAASSGLIARLRETRKIASAGQTVFNLADVTYVPGVNNIQVYVNGVAQVPGIDYSETDSDTITFLSGLQSGDAVDVYVNDATTNNVTDAQNVAYTQGGLNENVKLALDKRTIFVRSVAELKATPLEPGSIVRTRSYYGEAGSSSGAAFYTIVSSTDFNGTPDGYGDHTLDNGNIAVLDKSTGKIYARQYGATSASTSTPALQAFLDAVGTKQLKGFLSDGSFGFDADIFFHRNCNVEGIGHSFGSQLAPYGGARIRFDGSVETGGFVFHASLMNVAINGANSTLGIDDFILVNKCFSVDLAVRIENLPTGDAKTLIRITESNDISLHSPIVFGTSTTGGTGIRIGAGATVKIYKPDVEKINKGIVLDGDTNTVVDIYGPYLERCIRSIENKGGLLNIFGGKLINPSSSANLGLLDAPTRIYATKGALSGGTGFTSLAGTNPDVMFFGVDQGLIQGPWFTGSNVASNRSGSYGYENVITKFGLADNTFVDLFRVSTTSANIPIILEVDLWATSAGFGRAYKRYRFLVCKESGGSFDVSVIDTIDMTKNDSANFTITVDINNVLTTDSYTLQGKFDASGANNDTQAHDLRCRVVAVAANDTVKLETL